MLKSLPSDLAFLKQHDLAEKQYHPLTKEYKPARLKPKKPAVLAVPQQLGN